MNALANRAGGKGYESEKFYDNIRFDFKGIENIHKMRSSLKQLMSNLSSSSSMDSFLSELASSGWLKHIKVGWLGLMKSNQVSDLFLLSLRRYSTLHWPSCPASPMAFL